MPVFLPVLATSALATWGVAGGAALTIFGTTLTGFSAFLGRAAIGLALNALSQNLSKTKAGSSGGYNVTATGSASDHQIIYGKTKVAGVRLYDSVTGPDGRDLNRIIAFAGHEITAFDEIYFNDTLITYDGTGLITGPAQYANAGRIFFRTGHPGQGYMGELSAQDPAWTANHKLEGIAYIYLFLSFSRDSYPNGIPEVSAVIRGKPIYDPRTGLTGYSNNPALIARDYITSSYGLAAPIGEVDDARIQAAANVCDEAVEGEARYTCNGSFLTSGAPIDILTNIISSMAGTMWYAQGKWRVLAGKYVAPNLFLTADDLRSPITLSTRHSRRDNYNTVKGVFRGPSTNWNESDFPSVTDSAFLAADNGLEQSADVTLPFTTSSLTAQRIARVMLRRNRQQLTLKASFGLRAFKCQIGEIVSFDYPRFGWTNKEFEVVEWSFNPQEDGDMLIDMTLRETSADVFTNVSGAVLENDNTGLGSPTYVPPIGLSLTSEIRTISENVTNVIVIKTSGPATMIDYVEVQVQKVGASDWILVGSGAIGTFEYPVADKNAYNVRARGVNTLGVRGEWVTIGGFLIDNITVLPSSVASVSSSVNGNHVTLSWPAIDDLALSHYIVRHTTRTSGVSWYNSTVAVDKVPRPASSVTLSAAPGTYMVKAVDKFGNESPLSANVVVLSVPERPTVLLQTDSPSFSGTKSSLTVTSGNLRLTTYSSAPATGTYTFTNYIDTGSVRECQVRVDARNTVLSNLTQNWDDLGGLWDSWSGLWDDWGISVNFGDTDVKVYVSTTDDDPAGTPTWSAYTLFKGGVLRARAFRFQVVLSTNSAGFSPSVDSLVARVEY